MATLKMCGLSHIQIDKLTQIAKGQPLELFDCDGEYFNFPLTHIYDVREIIGHRPEAIDLHDDVIGASLRYLVGAEKVRIVFEMNDLDLGEIVITLTDAEMKELIADAGFAELRDGQLTEYIYTGTDEDGAPIEEPYSPSVFEWCDTAPNVETFNLMGLLTAYLFRKENRYYISAKMQLEKAA